MKFLAFSSQNILKMRLVDHSGPKLWPIWYWLYRMSQRQYDDVMMIKWWRNNNVTLRSNANNSLKCGSTVHLDHSTDSSSTIVPSHLPPTWTFTGKFLLFSEIFVQKNLYYVFWNLPDWNSTIYCGSQNGYSKFSYG